MTETAAKLAERFHETYERLAPRFGYRTREASAKPWADVPPENKALMIAVCTELLQEPGEERPQRQDSLDAQLISVHRAAVSMGCYDAADWLAKALPNLGRPVEQIKSDFDVLAFPGCNPSLDTAALDKLRELMANRPPEQGGTPTPEQEERNG